MNLIILYHLVNIQQMIKQFFRGKATENRIKNSNKTEWFKISVLYYGRKAKSIALIEEYLSADIRDCSEDLKDIKKEIRQIKKNWKALQNSDDKAKIQQLSQFITKVV